MFRNILVPTDGSPLSRKAIRRAVQLAREQGARITGLHVVAPYSPNVSEDIAPRNFETPQQYAKRSAAAAREHLQVIERAAKAFEQDGADAWYEAPLETFVPDGFTCERCGGAAFERERDILDVWFDSGSSHEAVLARRAELTWPADMYLEGTDQYRGWFQSSLLVAIGTRDKAPYRSVLTHGFVVVDHANKRLRFHVHVPSGMDGKSRSPPRTTGWIPPSRA